MKRSFINQKIRENQAFLRAMRFYLPPFAAMTAKEWRASGDRRAAYAEIADCRLGWDVTDFGSGDFDAVGLAAFTLRNGTLAGSLSGGKSYAEKVMFVQEGQVTPMHFHRSKMEDIINRGGGNLMIRVYESDESEGLAESDVVVSMDGVRRTVSAGTILRLAPGESITLPARQYHSFWGDLGCGKVLVGEVSKVNDDASDNRFLDELPRFNDVEEDEEAVYLLANEL